MKEPPFRCLFCLRDEGPFARVEHPIPESLGNDDFALPRGFVCDPCNNYFGSKVERAALASPLFGLERAGAAVPTKRGKLPSVLLDDGVTVGATGVLDTVWLQADPGSALFTLSDRAGVDQIIVPSRPADDLAVLRLLLKIGIELLLTAPGEVPDPYGPAFRAAARFARGPATGDTWDIGHAVWTNRRDLHLSTRVDEIGPLVTHQLYQYEIGVMRDGSIGFSFVYRAQILACMLTGPDLHNYVSAFNAGNQVRMARRTLVV